MENMEDLLSKIENRIASFYSLLNAPVQRDPHADCQNLTHVGPKVHIGTRTSILRLARAGFYNSQNKGIRCFSCHCEYNSWENESPVGVHRILNPDCKYLNSETSANNDTCFSSSSRQNLLTSDANTSCHTCGTSEQSVGATIGENEQSPSASNLNETPPRAANSVSEENQAQNVRRNLFPEEMNEINGRERDVENGNDSVSEINWMEHADEYSGKIIHPKLGDPKLMARESFRLLTFIDPTDTKAGEWAENGFIFYEENCVRCVYCGGCASFDENSVQYIHERISPKGRYCCPLVSFIDVGDVSCDLEILVHQKLLQRQQDHDNLGVINNYPILHPQFKTQDQRLASFKFWPKQFKQTKQSVAEAGFFQTGVVTKVVCFCCGVSIIDWEPTAVPWQQHALISPQCSFIKHEKGEDFITLMAAIEKLVDEDTSVTEPVTAIGDLVIPDPYPPTLDTTLLAAFSSCGYTRQQLFDLVLQIFKLTRGRYPNLPMLKAAVLADGELKKKEDLLDLHVEVIQKKDQQLDKLDHVMTVKDQHYRATVATINQQHCQQLNNKDLEIHEQSQQLQGKDQQLHLQNYQLHQKNHQLHQKNRLNHQLKLNKRQLRQQLNEKDNHIEEQSNHIDEQSNQIEEQSNQLEEVCSRLQLAVSRHEEEKTSLVLEKDSLIQEKNRIFIALSQEIERQQAELEREIEKYQKELSTLAGEYSRLKSAGKPTDLDEPNDKICLFCVTEERIVMFTPCHHVCCCLNCAPKFKNKTCPLCRVPIEDWQLVFLS